MTYDATAKVESLPIEEQITLTSGADFWHTATSEGVPSIMMTDGPHGLRKQTGEADHLGFSGSQPATCFPPAVALGQTWNAALAERVGAALGEEAQAAGVGVLLGPGINIKRDPRCGRNFEYFSEDPILTGELGTAWVDGLQSRGVGASLKHFALNNQEYDRMRISSEVDDRTMREIYLRGFEQVVRQAQPWTVMCSYNRINGVHASENPWLLTHVLRNEWGFEGAVVSDWGAVVDKVKAVAAGLDLQMPGPARDADEAVADAIRRSELDPALVTGAAARVASLAQKVSDSQRPDTVVNFEEHHELAREAATAAIVLLKNDRGLLPLKPVGKIAVIGEFAVEPRYQGGGSSHVNPTHLDVPLDELRSQAPDAEITFAAGFSTKPGAAADNLRQEAASQAREADAAVLFLGLSAAQESEGFDRDHIELPNEQLQLLAEVLKVQPDTVVVLSHGGVIQLSTGVTEAVAILDGALLGQGGGRAIANVLLGLANPSGRLAETVPERIEDVPAWLSFPGERGSVHYGEGIYVGYRWYDAREMDVTFPFGHGLSYTSFEYSELTVTADQEAVTVQLTVTNTGDRSGSEVVQVYTGLAQSDLARPKRELKGFTVLALEAGESRQAMVRLPRQRLATWDVRINDWSVEGGEYDVSVGASSRDIRITAQVTVEGDSVHVPLTLESSFAEVMAHPVAGPVLMGKLGAPEPEEGAGSELGMDVAKMAASIPVGRFLGQGKVGVTKEEVSAILEDANSR